MAVQQRATLDDVARLAGVSSKTVSRVYANPDVVSAETVERVLSAAKRLRFRPNALARTLRKGGASQTFGFLMGDLSNPFYYKVAAGIEAELSRNGFSLLVATTDDTAEGEERVAETLLAQRVGALLIIPVAGDQSHLEVERQLGTPMIAIDRPARNLVADAIVLENRQGAREATSRLLALGHRRIAYACNPADVYSQQERLRGYREAMAARGITDTGDLERLIDDRDLRPEEVIGGLLDGEHPPTAIFAGNNRMTVGALRAFRARPGRAEPALIGFDDFDTADVLGVSVVSYDPVELGRRAAMLAMERIADPTGFTRRVELPTWLIERGSGERPPSPGDEER
ncbi:MULTISPECIES: LacI family DNA-binding transcriptional regulator [unclassified Microbacterium]|uniref:LacI family DNA-binding transcriptional regulator n=1 Tax=unclassified Microbacterium TaxID=2609290 RepID=UPI0012FC8BCC|nr:LacI family DNA-binding transcriptional regulator [Microbacterium sp. MAH-37]MVQ40683.1 LacI family DNA-binding transcriptional regulator [Microbacterium sp. MAH-37]